MKKIHLLLGLVAATVIVSAGCSKSQKTPPAPEFQGVQVDLPKLTAAFENSSQELKVAATQVSFNVRYQKYEDALMGLDKLVNDPNVTDAQKKVVNEVIDQVKKLAGAAPAGAPAQ